MLPLYFKHVILALNVAFGVLGAALMVVAAVLALHAQAVLIVIAFTQTMAGFVIGLGVGVLFLARVCCRYSGASEPESSSAYPSLPSYGLCYPRFPLRF